MALATDVEHVPAPLAERAGAVPTPGRRRVVIWIGVVVVAVALVCGFLAAGAQAREASAKTRPSDYSQAAHWLSRPASPAKKVDVFYLYPTAYRKVNPTDPIISTIDDAAMIVGAKAALCLEGDDATTTLALGAGRINRSTYVLDEHLQVQRVGRRRLEAVSLVEATGVVVDRVHQ